MELRDIDIHFDVQTDSNGKDPDSASPTLRAYHQLLWSKPLPNGQEMKLGIEKNCLKWGDIWFGSIIFPMHRWSMNQARGCSVKICDRWDLTLECIRRFYAGESTPLDKALEKDRDFFSLFVDFKGYVDFFLLQDCVDEKYNVKKWLDTNHFDSMPMPKNIDEYYKWIDTQLDFVAKRGKRIEDYCKRG